MATKREWKEFVGDPRDFCPDDAARSAAQRAENHARFLERLADCESQGMKRVEWTSAKGESVCHLCRKRDGKVFTIAEARRIITRSKHYCLSIP